MMYVSIAITTARRRGTPAGGGPGLARAAMSCAPRRMGDVRSRRPQAVPFPRRLGSDDAASREVRSAHRGCRIGQSRQHRTYPATRTVQRVSVTSDAAAPPGAAGSRARRGSWCRRDAASSCSARLLRPAGTLQQVTADGGEPVVPGERSSSVASSARPASGPSHHGERDRAVERHHRVAGHPLEQPVQREQLRPVGRVGASAPRRARRRSRPAAGTPRRRRARGRPRRARRPRRSSRGPRARGPGRPSETSSPCGPVRAGRRASVSRIRASRPVTSGSSGRLACRVRVRRRASTARSARATVEPVRAGVALVEHQVQHAQDGAEPLGVLVRPTASGTARRAPAACGAPG